MTSPLRRARDAKGWSQAGTANRLVALARDRNAKVSPSVASAKQMISDWEGGRRTVGPDYRPLLCELYEATPAELGLAEKQQDAEPSPAVVELSLVNQITASRTIDPAVVVQLQNQVNGIRLLDRRLGAPAVIDQTRGLVRSMEQMMVHTLLPASRQPLAAVLADAATLAAWQCLDAGCTNEAWQHYATARVAGQESGDTTLLVHAMGEQANVLLDLNLPVDAVQLLEAALETGKGKIPRLLVAWLYAAQGEARAAAGDEVGCRRALDLATTALPSVVDMQELPYLALNDEHLARWRGHSLARIGDAAATADLMTALTRMDQSFVRARASLETDLARALLIQGEREEATKHAQSARALAKQTGSIRQLKRVEDLGQAA